MKKKIIIVGAGGYGREILYLTKTILKYSEEYKGYSIAGFINDKLDALDNVDCDYKILGTIQDWKVSSDEVFVMALSSPSGKEKLAKLLKSKGAKFLTLIHPQAFISEKVVFGEGCIVTYRSSVGACTVIGDFVNLAGCMVGQDAVIGDYSTITGFANVTSAKIGKRVFIGSHSVILNNLKIGDDAFICAGSIVFSNIKSGVKVIGYPAKKANF